MLHWSALDCCTSSHKDDLHAMPAWVPARLPSCALLEHACTSARKGKCPLPSWCYTRLCVVALIVQGDMLDATPADLLAACWRTQSGFPSCAYQERDTLA